MTLNNEILRISIHSVKYYKIKAMEPPQISIYTVTLTQAIRFGTIFTNGSMP